MDKIRIGIIGTSDVAFRRFLPALMDCPMFEYVGVASRDLSKTKMFIDKYGGKGYDGYDALLNSDEIDAVYIPLPPALHYKWGKKALEKGKHVFMEKPFTMSLHDTEELIALADEKKLSIHENSMFLYHNQMKVIKKLLSENKIGDIRLIRTRFGFPFRGTDDFRYNKELGGGALFDCGYYPIKISAVLLGDSAEICTSHLNYSNEYNVDIAGTATLENDSGLISQVSFGIDNSYKCELEIWGSKGEIHATRIFTAPPTLNPEIILTINGDNSVIYGGLDNQFLNSINLFYNKIKDTTLSRKDYQQLILQSRLMESINEKGRIY